MVVQMAHLAETGPCLVTLTSTRHITLCGQCSVLITQAWTTVWKTIVTKLTPVTLLPGIVRLTETLTSELVTLAVQGSRFMAITVLKNNTKM